MSPPDLFREYLGINYAQFLDLNKIDGGQRQRLRKITPRIEELVNRFEPENSQGSTSISAGNESNEGYKFFTDADYTESDQAVPLDLDTDFPRVPVTPSMLYAHACARGKFGDREGDPVHHALFLAPNRGFGARPIWVRMTEEGGSMEDLPPGMKFYWDPLVQKPESPPSTPADIQGQKLKSKKATPLTYLEHIAQNPPTVGKNHYKGDYVYANFGYVRDEDTMEWFDPESSQPLKDKYISYRREGPIEEVDGKHIPDFKRSERIFPRIMSTEEQEHFYDEYLQYVHDDVDAEGDPRDLRITPATFAQWAVGARKGKAYEEEEFTPDSVIWSKRVVPPKQPKDSRPKRRQFDMVTGEEISELGDSDEEAVLITEAEGVNMMAIPREFSMMLPGVAQDLAHKAFGHRENDPEKYSQGSITSSDHDTASDPTVFNETRAVNHLGTLGDPMSGKAEFAGLSEEMLNLLDEKRLAEKRTVQKQEELAQAREVEIGLAREIFFLNARKNLQPIRVVNRGNPHGMDGAGSFDPSLSEGISNFDGSDEHEEELMSPASLPKQHKQFRRYFKEQIATESMAINRLNIYADVSDMEYERIRKDINVMRGVKDELVRSFGVENMEDIPLHVPHPLYMDRVDFAGGQSTYE